MRLKLGLAQQLAIASAVLVLIPLLLVQGAYGRHLLTLTLIFCSLAVSLNLVMGYAGLVSVAHGAFFGIGAYTSALMTVDGFPFVVSVLAGMALSAAAGTLLGVATLRLRGHYFSLGTLAFTMVVVIVLERWEEVTRGPRGVSNIPRPGTISLPGLDVSFSKFWPMYLLAAATLMLFLVLTSLIVRSPFGRALLCIQRNELLGKVYGVNIVRTKLKLIALSAAMASVSGSIYASYIAYIAPNVANFMQSFDAIMYVVVGGSGTVWGPVFGTLFIQLLPEVLRGFEDIRHLILGLLLVAVIRFFPSGLSGLPTTIARRLRGGALATDTKGMSAKSRAT